MELLGPWGLSLRGSIQAWVPSSSDAKFQCLLVCFSCPAFSGPGGRGKKDQEVACEHHARCPHTISASRPREGSSGAHRKMLTFQEAMWLLSGQRTGHRPFVLEALTKACSFLLPAWGFHLPTQQRGETEALSLTSELLSAPTACPALPWVPSRAWPWHSEPPRAWTSLKTAWH